MLLRPDGECTISCSLNTGDDSHSLRAFSADSLSLNCKAILPLAKLLNCNQTELLQFCCFQLFPLSHLQL